MAMHRLPALLLIAIAMGSCAGERDEAARETTGEAVAHGATMDHAMSMTGGEIFIEAGCGNCHTLEAADTTGTVGPNLDEHLMDDHAGVRHVAAKIRRGGDGMPSFASTLSDEEILRLARFVHDATAP
jgi:mono/diheme cytochrome c family protein